MGSFRSGWWPVIGGGAVAALLSWCAVAGAAGAQPSPRELVSARSWAAAHLAPAGEGADIPGLRVRRNYGIVQRDGRGKAPLHLGAQAFDRGLYCHANSEVEVRLPAEGARFTALAGVDSNSQTSGGRGSVVFSVEVDGAAAFRSDVVHEGAAPVAVDVPLAGARSFALKASDSGDGISCDQSDWADARVTLTDGTEVWLGDLGFLEDAGPLPFSFTLDGRPSAELLATWPRQDEVAALDAVRTQRTTTWTDPTSGLQVRCVSVTYADGPVVEWTVYLRNDGAADSGLLEAVQGLDMTLQHPVESEFTLHGITGDSCTPDSYEPYRIVFRPGESRTFAAAGGRPTNGTFPYYNLQTLGRGLILGLGWPGQWESSFTRDDAAGLHVTGGQQQVRLRLKPGEEIRTPLVVLLKWDGDDVVRAQNLWRRWMTAHNLPHPGGSPPRPLLAFCDGGFMPGLRCSEAGEKQFMEVLDREGIGLDYWWMDAGWYPCHEWWDGVGTWEVDRERFPNGIRAVSDAAHARGAGLILWFEPERVHPGTWLDTNHPEWLLGAAGDTRLLNLGNPEARQWLTDHVDQFITEQGIDLYRQDFNMDPLGYWRANDAQDRQGMTENLHVQGYLAYWDELLRRHPGMLIDSCASGGRRNDLETLRRAVPLLRSDYQSFAGDSGFAIGNQGHTYGLSSWIPYFGQGVYYSGDNWVYCVRSYLTPAFGMAVDVRQPGVDWDLYRRMVADYRAVADCFAGDYYPLTSYSLDEGSWMGWQFDLPAEGRGMVQAFRHARSPYLTCQFALRGLDPGATYEIRDLDGGPVQQLTGAQLMDPGLPVSIEQRAAAVIYTYQRRP
jgi:alpha-galactosidase